jgi:hypothetical protein
MSDTNTGGPAFPHTVEYKGAECGGVAPHGGMTLRDYFAAKAMQAYIADEKLIDMFCYLEKDVKHELAVTAYMMADAMLEARQA